MRILLIILLALAQANSVAQSQAPAFDELAGHYDYDRQPDLDFTEVGVEMRGKVMVLDLLYKGDSEARVPAYLVVPKGEGPFAGIVWGHWMMDGSPMRNRREFLEEAVVLARSGVVSLLIDLPEVRPGFVAKDVQKEPLEWAIQQSEVSRQTVVDLRRGLGLLLNHRHVDPKRVAYVGHSFSAHTGAILAGVEKRIQNFVLMAGAYSDEEFVRASNRPEIVAWRAQVGGPKVDQYFRQYAWDDPVNFVGHTDADNIFLQFATGDGVSPAEAQRELSRFSASSKQSKVYDAGHALNSAARVDRDRWLQHVLKLKTVDEKALGEIPQLK
ncbi:MAG TPA: hypothetical protein VEW69_13280 [Alphaproteobacteria bacterium]|nr:hypothetical protein [Alphaproteobacteria bacterium]